MPGDAMKKVSPGDPLVIPASTYNRMVDAARANTIGVHRNTRGGKGRAGRVIALNGTGRNIAAGSVVSTSRLGVLTPTFVDPISTPPYAIILEPIPTGKYGLIAVAGGPYKVLADDTVTIAAGDQLAPQSGTYVLEKNAAGSFTAMGTVVDSECMVVIGAAPGGTVELYQMFFESPTPGTVILADIQGWLQINTTGNITNVRTASDQVGIITIDLWVTPFTGFFPTDSDSITAGNPAGHSGVIAADAAMTDWSVGVTAGDMLLCNVDYCSAIEKCLVAIEVTRT